MAERQSTQIQEQQGGSSALLGQNKLAIPSFNLGSLAELDPRVIPPEGLQEAVNCFYRNGQLYVGRPGFSRVTSEAAPGAIKAIATAIDGTVFVATDSAVYQLSDGSLTELFSVAAAPTLISFKDSLFVCDGERLKRWDGSDLFLCGSHYPGMLEGKTLGDLDWIDCSSSTRRCGVKLAASSSKRRIATFTVHLKAGGPSDGYAKAEIYKGTTLVASSTNEIDQQAIPTVFSPYTFYFNDVDLDADAEDYYVVVSFPDLDSGHIYVAQLDDQEIADGVPVGYESSWQEYPGTTLYACVNGMERPVPTYGIVAQSRLFLVEGARIWFCGPNDPETYSSLGGGGFFTFGDDEDAIAKALLFLDGKLWISGKARGMSQSISYNISPIDALSEEDIVAHGAVCTGGLNVVNETMLITGRGWVGARKVSYVGDKTFLNISGFALARDVLTESTFVHYHYPDLWWLVHGGGNSIYVMAVETRNPQTVDGPWTRFDLPFEPSVFADVSGDLFVGATNGHVYKLDWDSNTDDGIVIKSKVTTSEFTLGDLSTEKVIRRFKAAVGLSEVRGITLRVYTNGNYGLPSLEEDIFVQRDLDFRTRLKGSSFAFELEVHSPPKPFWLGPVEILFTPCGQQPTL